MEKNGRKDGDGKDTGDMAGDAENGTGRSAPVFRDGALYKGFFPGTDDGDGFADDEDAGDVLGFFAEDDGDEGDGEDDGFGRDEYDF